MIVDVQRLMSETKFYESYSRFIPDLGRYETWDESVTRVMDMHRTYYAEKLAQSDELAKLIDFTEEAYLEQRVLGAQRALQFGGEQILAHHIRIYNCVSSWLDRTAFFGEYMYMLLGGAGAGFSVQRHHVGKLPEIAPRTGGMDFFVVPDCIEGWAEALDVLLSSYFAGEQKHSHYAGKKVVFDYSQIRPKGAPISGGFKAPGPEPLAKALKNIELLLERILAEGVRKMRPIHVYDIAMHAADAVISGGVRRAATICLFDKDDEEMLKAKTGNWIKENPQRARSNNSAVCVRDELTRAEFHNIMVNVRQFGEPGFVLTDNRDFTVNPLTIN